MTRILLCGPCDAGMLEEMVQQMPDLHLTTMRDRREDTPPGATWADKKGLEDFSDLALTPDQEVFHEQVMRLVMSDSRSFFLLERIMTDTPYGTAFNGLTRIDQYIRRAIKLLDAHDPQRVIFMSTPHDILWFFARTAEARGCEILVLKPGPIPGGVFVARGLDAQTVLETTAGDTAAAPAQARDFIAIRQRSYAEAEPDYERRARESYGEGFFSVRAELRKALASGSAREAVQKLLLIPLKRSALRCYEGHAISRLDPAQQGRAVVFFLHYQPERSSLPEGGDYAQQLRVAHTLAAALPDGWELLIKEHPSFYRRTFKPRVRDMEFYTALSRLPRTRLVDLSMDTFSLIDHAAVIVTLTGTVGLEAISRGKPALAFGCACYQNAPGVTRVASLEEARTALARIAQASGPSASDVETWLTWAATHAAPESPRDPIARRAAIIASVGAPQTPRPALEDHQT